MASQSSTTVFENTSSRLDANPALSLKSKQNPKDSMKSTWRQANKSNWTKSHWFFEILGLHHVALDEDVPVHQKGDKVPYTPEWQLHRWVLVHALVPIAIQHAYAVYTGQNLTPFQAFLFYTVAFKVAAVHTIHALRRIGHQTGFLDGDKHERDGVPDVGVTKVVKSLIATSGFRPVFTVFLSYRTAQAPSSMNWLWLPLEIGLYGIVLDFWFYWYHRLMHEVGSLWQYHRTHHLTKHPNPLLTLYADFEQEIFDIAVIPIMTYLSLKFMGLPMGFYDWWICHQYVMFTELGGHSGLRVYTIPPSTLGWLLRLVDAELVIEDHDLHHRKGWKTSGNYGKQTRLWDKVFGTCIDRVELKEGNMDWEKVVDLPIFW
ncbi:Ff.00g084490.m01.CDS01 [Fusarium sp. VM40]|nr:Ff.00g084490.m01.CDS01 [Fusarium sp. VM40]